MQRGRVQKSNTCIKQCTCVCVDMHNVFHGMCAYKCTVHECMYVLCKRFHFRRTVCECVCVTNSVQAIFIPICVHRCVHSCTCTLCENSVKMRTQLMSLQVVQACVCVHASVWLCVCVMNIVYRLFT